MSAFLMVELTMRSVESLRSSLARIASLTALLMSSRSIVLSSRGPAAVSIPPDDLGGPRRSNNSHPQPFGQRFAGGLRPFRLRAMAAVRKDHQFCRQNAFRHFLGQ